MKLTRKDIQFIAICVGASALVVIAAHLLWPPQRLSQENYVATDANKWWEKDPLAETSQTVQYSYVASAQREVFHKPSCRWAKKISRSNLIVFKTRDEAIKSGRRPCKVCKP